MSFIFGGGSKPKPQPQPTPAPAPKKPELSEEQRKKQQRAAQGRRRGLATVLGGSGDTQTGTPRKSLLGA
jgi:hypothetical protein